MRHITILFAVFSISVSVKSQTILKSPTEIDIPNQIVNIQNDSILKAFTIDFNGDNKLDYIITVQPSKDYESLYQEYWYTSDYRFYRKVNQFDGDFDLKYFVNLDNDSIPEIVRATGFSDGIDYFVTKQDTLKKNEEILFYFLPIIKKEMENRMGYYWGYPKSLRSIFINTISKKKLLLCSINHIIVRDGEIYYPENQRIFPILMFDGNPQSNYSYEAQIENSQWLTIDEIIKSIKK
jgi:hypothetical protein